MRPPRLLAALRGGPYTVAWLSRADSHPTTVDRAWTLAGAHRLVRVYREQHLATGGAFAIYCDGAPRWVEDTLDAPAWRPWLRPDSPSTEESA